MDRLASISELAHHGSSENEKRFINVDCIKVAKTSENWKSLVCSKCVRCSKCVSCDVSERSSHIQAANQNDLLDGFSLEH